MGWGVNIDSCINGGSLVMGWCLNGMVVDVKPENVFKKGQGLLWRA